MLLRCVLTVLIEMYISLATSAVLSMSETCRRTSRSRSVRGSTATIAGRSGAGAAGGEGRDGQKRGPIWSGGVAGSGELIAAQGRGQQTVVAAGQFRVTFQCLLN